MTNREEFLNKISGNDDNISIEEYMPIMKMILSPEELYIVCKMNKIRVEENEEYSHHFTELENLNDQSRHYKLKQLSIIEGRAINKLKKCYEINNSFVINKDELINYYTTELNTIDEDIKTVNSIKMGEEKELKLYQFPFSVIKFHDDNMSLSYYRKPYYLKHLTFCRMYYENKINKLNNKEKVLKNKK